jgi:hypothetical protein
MGQLSQCAKIDRFTNDDGPERGTRLLRLVSGGGLSIDVYPDRALDLGQVEVAGVPLAWMSPTGFAHPAMHEADGDGFLRTFGGGFLSTCGLDHFGPPCEEDGQRFGQHGRFGAVPASLARTEVTDAALVVEGTVRQAAVHKEYLELRRRIEVPLGGTSFTITDIVTNLGPREQPHMILYHCNFGWPLLSEDAVITVPATQSVALDPRAEQEAWATLAAPRRGHEERCWLHTLRAGEVTVSLENPKAGVGLAMTFDSGVLPGLVQWKMLGERQYVLGLEPTNGLCTGGRAAARQAGRLVTLAPGQRVTYALRFDVRRH